MLNAIHTKWRAAFHTLIGTAALIGLTSCEATTMTDTQALTTTNTRTTFGDIKTGVKPLRDLGAFEKSVIPLVGFTFFAGGITSVSAIYSVDISSATVTVTKASQMGLPVNIAKDEKSKIKLSEVVVNEMLRISNVIWRAEKSFANFPPRSASFDVRLILTDGDITKDITSYGTPKLELNELFKLTIEQVAKK